MILLFKDVHLIYSYVFIHLGDKEAKGVYWGDGKDDGRYDNETAKRDMREGARDRNVEREEKLLSGTGKGDYLGKGSKKW